MNALLEVLTRAHDKPLLLSLVAATAGSLVARVTLGRSCDASRWGRLAWLAAATAGFLAGTLATYVLTVRAMFPYLDPVSDLLANPAGSVVAALGAAAGLGIATHARSGYRDLLFAGAVLAGGIACMLFLDLSSLAQPHRLAWELLPVTGTVLLTALLCGLGLVGMGHRGTPMQYIQGASCLAAAQVVLSLASLTSILSFSDWLAESGNSASLATEPIVAVVSACGFVVAGLGLTGAALDHRAAQLNQREGDRLRQLADSALEGILIHRDGRVMDANAAFCQLAGAPLQAVRGRAMDTLFRLPGDTAPWAVIAAGARDRHEIELLSAAGAPVPVEVIAHSIHYRDGPVQVLAVRDIRERREAEDRIRHLAHHDALTGLANRSLLREQLGQVLGAHLRMGEPFAVICLDLDRFKAVNDTLGHSAGDQVLVQVAARLRGCTRAHEMVARTGGDEFVLLQTGVPQPQSVTSFADRLIAAVSAPFDLDGKQASIGASIGIAVCPQDGNDIEDLLGKADLALYRAKSQGRGVSCFFEPAMETRMREQRRLERDLRLALGTDQIALHYQPQYDCAGVPKLVGFEALMRWTHPERGRISPAQFIPVAEEAGLIAPLGLWALERACADAMTWPSDCRVAVNLSAAQLRAGNLPAAVARILRRTALPASRLELEVTESLLIGNPEEALRALAGLKTLGVRIALDDFGTGYSSLSYLQRFPFDKLKIDKSFIDGLETTAGSRSIVEAILAMSRSLHLDVTAEGVETNEQLAILRALSCGTIQGFLLGRPMPLKEAASLFAAKLPDQSTSSCPDKILVQHCNG